MVGPFILFVYLSISLFYLFSFLRFGKKFYLSIYLFEIFILNCFTLFLFFIF